MKTLMKEMPWHLPEKDTYFAPHLKRPSEGFEIEHLKEALKYVTSFRVAVDVGAHVGTWSNYLSQYFEGVYAFEPASDTYACLKLNVGDWSNVATFNVALGEKPGICSMVDDPTRAGNTGARMTGKGVGVQVLTLASIHIPELDFLKIDVEGDEAAVLRGGLPLILKTLPVICVECKEFPPPRNGGPAAIRALLKSIGYTEVGGIRNDRIFVCDNPMRRRA